MRASRAALVEADAISLVDRFGGGAYAVARDRSRAERHGAVVDANRPRRHWVQVKLRIAELCGKEVGLDTATRYLTAPEVAATETPYDGRIVANRE